MLACDLAILGGGTTLFELAATGTSALAFCLIDNQVENVKGMVESRTVISLGWGNEWGEEEVHTKINNYALREKISKLGRELTDGKGSWRVSKLIIEELLNRKAES